MNRDVLIRLGLPATGAWLLAALAPRSLIQGLAPARFEFALPRVSVPYTPGTDVVSAVPDLFSALLWGVICAGVVELAKPQVLALSKWRGRCMFLCAVFQGALVLDTLRRHAWDWYGYLLYFLRLTKLSYDNPRPEVISLPAPWLSFLVLAFVLTACALATLRRSGTSEVAQEHISAATSQLIGEPSARPTTTTDPQE